jgi:hypothetical protein
VALSSALGNWVLGIFRDSQDAWCRWTSIGTPVVRNGRVAPKLTLCRPIPSSPVGSAGSPFELPSALPDVSSAPENSEHSVIGSPVSFGERCAKTNRPITRSGELPT